MSGIEVAGLLVGAFPLIISALEHYHEAHKAIFRFETEYRKTLEDVKDEQLLFRLVLEQLLSPLCTDDAFDEGHIEQLLDPNGPSCNMVETTAAERLGHTYGRFMEIAGALHSTICKPLISLTDKKPQLQARLKSELVLILL